MYGVTVSLRAMPFFTKIPKRVSKLGRAVSLVVPDPTRTLCRPIGAAVSAAGGERETDQAAQQLIRHRKSEHRGVDRAPLGEHADLLFVYGTHGRRYA
jgi:hypothetical protein